MNKDCFLVFARSYYFHEEMIYLKRKYSNRNIHWFLFRVSAIKNGQKQTKQKNNFPSFFLELRNGGSYISKHLITVLIQPKREDEWSYTNTWRKQNSKILILCCLYSCCTSELGNYLPVLTLLFVTSSPRSSPYRPPSTKVHFLASSRSCYLLAKLNTRKTHVIQIII